MESWRNQSAGKQAAQNDSPEQLLDVFKAAALSVTKLYKTSAKVEARARADGYQECLEDLFAFLDKENIGNFEQGVKIRRWVLERIDGRDEKAQSAESEDENEKVERTSSPEVIRTSAEPTAPSQVNPIIVPPTTTASYADNHQPPRYVLPTSDTFSLPSYPNIATLDLSDARPQDAASFPSSRNAKSRLNGVSSRSASRLGRGAGSKRKIDIDDFFGGCLDGKDLGNSSKRSRHA